MFSRQKALLRLIENDGGTISRLRLVKLAFLLSRESAVPRSGIYDFIPFKRGPFSFTLYHELRTLERDGWLTESDTDVQVVDGLDRGTNFLDKTFLSSIDSISRRYRSVSTPTMVDVVYRDYPWFTQNSENIRKRSVQRPQTKPAVYTVGYEGLMVDALLDLLLRQGIERLIDVRCNPIARRYGFHKSTISNLCGDLGIEYVHIPALGVPSSWRTDLSDESSYNRLLERYEQEVLPSHRVAVENAAGLVGAKPSALMCMEEDHHCCHRSRLAAKISGLTLLPVKELRGM